MIVYSHHNLLNQTSNFSSFWGAFLGAFFAFVFGLITYIVTKRRERFVLHKNVLIKLNRVLNKHLNDLGVLEKIVEDSKRIMEGNKVTSNRLFNLELPENIETDLGSVDLINKLFSYRLSIDRLSFNSATINHALTRLEDLFINGQPVRTENFEFIKNTLEGFSDELPKLNVRTVKLLLLTRIHQNKLRTKKSFIYGVFNTQWEQKISKDEIGAEKKKLDEEIKQMYKDYENSVF